MKVINFGPTGVGKTFSLSTIPKEYKVRILFTENGLDTLGRAFADKGERIPPHFAWRYVKMQEANFEGLLDMTNKINMYDLEGLTRLPINSLGKSKQPEFASMLGALFNFTDERTGEVFGPADSWGNDTVLVIDTLTGLSDAMTRLQCGLRPIKSMADWQIIQNHIERVVNTLSSLQCHVIINGHWEKELNEVTGGMEIMLSTPGRKLAPKMSRYMSDVILSRRVEKNYLWSTIQNGADLKTRHLALADNIQPNYALMLSNWRKFAEAGL